MNPGRQQAVLITGVYGSGKSAVAQEMAYLLEKQGAPYGLLDLDFLGWADTQTSGPQVWPDVMLRNLAAVAGNYRAAGIAYFVVAGAVRSADEFEGIKAALAMAVSVVRLTVPLATIEDRLRSDPTAGRGDDLREAASWLAQSVGVGLEDREVPNDDRPIREVAEEVLEWLGWRGAANA
jgi:hypothetical protein